MNEAQKAAERWRSDDKEILGRIGAYLTVTGKSVGDLARRIGMAERTMYNRLKDTGTFRLEEYRKLMDEIRKAVVMP